MHGIIFNQLFKFVRESQGEKTLQKILKDAGIGPKFYDATKFYPDEELERIASSACKILNVRRNDLLELFGSFIAPGLLRIYQSFFKEEWDAMDLLENIETTIHRAVRLNDPQATPPTLKIERTGPDDISIIYTSERDMINLGIGIIKEIGHQYKTRFDIKKVLIKDGTMLKIKRLK